MHNLTQDLLHELFEYKDGQLTWKESRGCVKAGAVAGNLKTTGYIQIRANKKVYKAHRLVWNLHNGDIPDGLQIDHINGIRDDNRIENLRLATHHENQFNTKSKGYTWHKRTKKWKAQIMLNYKCKYLGLFNTKQEARAAYIKAKTELHKIIDRTIKV